MYSPLHVGVIPEEIQFADIAGIDILGNISAKVANTPGSFFTQYKDFAAEMEFHFISSSLKPAMMSPCIKVLPTVTYNDAPRDRDILIIGGPIPTHHPAAADKFLKEAAKETKIFLTTCTGSMWLASSGALDGKKATTNRECLELAKQMYRNVEWLEQRWVVDGKFWTAGGALAGVDMIVIYAGETFDKAFVQVGLNSLDVDPAVKGQFFKGPYKRL